MFARIFWFGVVTFEHFSWHQKTEQRLHWEFFSRFIFRVCFFRNSFDVEFFFNGARFDRKIEKKLTEVELFKKNRFDRFVKNQTWWWSETALLLSSQSVLIDLNSATTLQCSSPSFDDNIFFSNMGQPPLLLCIFLFFILKILVASRIQTGIVGEEGEDANH